MISFPPDEVSSLQHSSPLVTAHGHGLRFPTKSHWTDHTLLTDPNSVCHRCVFETYDRVDVDDANE